jgi:GNAT superfamily N-acetyltransferase
MVPRVHQPLRLLAFRSFELSRVSDIRAMQIGSFRVASSHLYDDSESLAYERYIASGELVGRLHGHDVEMALVAGQVVGTVGWTRVGDGVVTARLTDLFVDPLFMRLGIGSQLVRRAEERVRRGGFAILTTCGSPAMTLFFRRLGFRVSARGRFAPAATSSCPSSSCVSRCVTPLVRRSSLGGRSLP